MTLSICFWRMAASSKQTLFCSSIVPNSSLAKHRLPICANMLSFSQISASKSHNSWKLNPCCSPSRSSPSLESTWTFKRSGQRRWHFLRPGSSANSRTYSPSSTKDMLKTSLTRWHTRQRLFVAGNISSKLSKPFQLKLSKSLPRWTPQQKHVVVPQRSQIRTRKAQVPLSRLENMWRHSRAKRLSMIALSLLP